MSKRIVDPPSGWRYGFPKECPEDVWHDHDRFKQFLLESGYPVTDIEFASQYVRVWFEEDDDTPGF